MMHKRHQTTDMDRANQDAIRLMSGELNADEINSLADWEKQSTSYQQQFLETLELFSELPKLAEDADVLAAARQKTNGKKSATPSKHRSMQWLAIAASLLIAATLFVLPYGDDPQAVYQPVKRYVTRIGEQKMVELPDGSQLHLNTGTQLIVDYSEHARRVILDRGEVYFDIASDPLRPFTVDLKNPHLVTALGTEFNIEKSPDNYVLSVTEGVVSLHPSAERIDFNQLHKGPPLSPESMAKSNFTESEHFRVKAGTVVKFDQNQRDFSVHTETDIERLQDWRDGIISFQSEPLHKVILELNRYSAKKILIDGKNIRDLEIYAAIKVNEIHTGLKVIEKILPVKTVHYFDRIVIVEKHKKQTP
ncbi:FecR domain-containing protein [Porticoccus sp. W117]|uniref:FecR family protein n=1 Tax=Porticoccus sp. W117 TaxID=3054777 RepID=UPI0025931290|nr:FecR domain-containing protein [Porticoccus sp. W117]MDM3871878.1 FecR domain-containing protein [Porticoccus sp. W117]